MTDTKVIGGRTVRWDDERAAEAYARGWWVRTTLADSLADAAQRTPHRVVLIDGEHRIDCQTLHEKSVGLAGMMLNRIPIGSVVSFMLPNWHEAAVIYLAATIAGMVVNPILTSLRDHELSFILDDANTRMIFVPAAFGSYDYPSMLRRVTEEMADAPEVVVVRGGTALPSAPAAELPTLDPDAVRMILYTSGTTGRPKGVLHSHNSIHALIAQLREHWQLTAGDRYLVPSPIAHIGGSIYAFEFPLLLETSAVLMDRWDADAAVELIGREGCTHVSGATPFLEQLLTAAKRAGSRLPALRMFVCGGASVSPSLIRRAADYFESAAVTRVYGSTEVPVTTVGAPDDPDHAADTDGRRGFTRIVLSGDSGEIHARGPQMLVGYLHTGDDTESFDSEGYFRTGDLARWVDDDYLVVTGRAKDLIIRNGENIAPKEIEDILIGHPDIAEIAIVGLPDPRTGERACAVVVATDHAHPDVDSLRVFLQDHGVAIFKAPEQVVIWDALPRNDAGKVLKHQIQTALATTNG